MPAPSTAVTKFWAVPELFVTPTPPMVKVNVGLAVIVNALAPALNMRPFTSVLVASETSVVLERSNVAVSAGPFGTVGGVQLAGLFQLPSVGLRFHVALPAWVTSVARSNVKAAIRSAMIFLMSCFR